MTRSSWRKYPRGARGADSPPPATPHADVAIVGAGIVGLATALALTDADPALRVTLLEQESELAAHQTGRNSGVIHAGIYYAPGSLKARFCRDGAAATRAFCDTHGVPYQTPGKLIVATDPAELPGLAALADRAQANGLTITRLDGAEARALEPHIRAEAAILSPDTGIVDFAAVARAIAAELSRRGVTIRTGARVTGGAETAQDVTLSLADGSRLTAGRAVFCAGLWADRLARTFGAPVDFRIIPFRGDTFRILNQPADLVRHLIYPVPDPTRPFLGVHLTRKMDGGFTVGPSAVLALKRDGYAKTDISLRDLASAAAYPGLWRLIARNARATWDEGSAAAIRALYLRKVQRYCPTITARDMAPYRAGIRAQAVRPDGTMVEDFLFARTPRTLHVCNAPSPAATAAIPIGQHIAAALYSP